MHHAHLHAVATYLGCITDESTDGFAPNHQLQTRLLHPNGYAMRAAAAYLGCFNDAANDGNPVLPETLAEELTTAGNITEQCWQLAAASKDYAQPLFGVNGRKCFGGRDLGRETALGPAPESACASNKPNVSGNVHGTSRPYYHSVMYRGVTLWL
jgi:hypothetical protein